MAYGEKYADMEREKLNQLKPQDEYGPSVNMGAQQIGLYRPSIQDRINRTLAQVQSTYERAGAAQRAKEIIEKNPEFAELLDLLERF